MSLDAETDSRGHPLRAYRYVLFRTGVRPTRRSGVVTWIQPAADLARSTWNAWLVVSLPIATMAASSFAKPLQTARVGNLPRSLLIEAAQCSGDTWTSASPLIPKEKKLVVRWPSMSSGSAGSFVAGNNIMLFDDQPVPRAPLSIVKVGFGQIGGPPGPFAFVFPKVGSDSSGVLQMVWGEPDQPAAAVPAFAWPSTVTSLWASSYSPTAGWSNPKRILENAGGIRWPENGPSLDARTGDAMIFGLTVFGGRGRRGVVVVKTAKDWVSVDLPPVLAVDASAAVQGDKEIAVALLSTYGSKGSQSNKAGIALVRSHDGGISWGEPIVISDPSPFPAQNPKAWFFRDSLHVMWVQALDDGSSVIRQVASAATGPGWTRPVDIPLASGYRNVGAVIDACGRLHIAYEHWGSEENGHVDYSYYDGKWSKLEHLFSEWRVGSKTIHLTSSGEVALVLLAQKATDVLTSSATVLISLKPIAKR